MVKASRRNLLLASLVAATLSSGSGAQASNVLPLAFGMTPQDAANALRVSLVYVRGRPGSEVFVTQYDAGVPGFYPTDERIYLQFRRGGLTGWKKDWRVRKDTLF
jgi:hypothetical protein